MYSISDLADTARVMLHSR